jgi:hypothetical protein
MPYHLYWLAEPRILYAEASGVFTLAEVADANKNMATLLDETAETLYLLCDVSAMTEYPRIVTQLREVVPYFYHPMFGCEYFYGVKSPAISVILRLLSSFSPFDYKLVPSLDSALAALALREPGLRDTIANIDRTLAHIRPVAAA